MSKRKRRISKQRITLYIAFMCYVLYMMYLLFFRRIENSISIPYAEYVKTSVNFIPFKTIEDFVRIVCDRSYSGYLLELAYKNLGGNIILFIPLGFFLPSIWRKARRLKSFIIKTVIIIASIEILQFVTQLGSCDIDDLIFNLGGALIGFGLWKFKPIARTLKKYGFI